MMTSHPGLVQAEAFDRSHGHLCEATRLVRQAMAIAKAVASVLFVGLVLSAAGTVAAGVSGDRWGAAAMGVWACGACGMWVALAVHASWASTVLACLDVEIVALQVSEMQRRLG